MSRGAAAIIVLNWNGLEDSLACMQSLLCQTYQNRTIFLVDNGSDHDGPVLSQQFGDTPGVSLIRFAENLGFAKGMNQVVSEHVSLDQYTFVALMNNDAVAEPDWLEQLIFAADEQQADMVSSCMVNFAHRDLLDNCGHQFLNTGEVLPRGAEQAVSQFQRSVEVEGACGGGCLLRTSLVQQLGLFDPFFSTGYEDAEYGLRVVLAGGKTIYAPRAVVYHKISASLNKIRDRDYAISLQVNIYYSYFKLMPLGAILANMPFMLLRLLGTIGVSALFFRWQLLDVQISALKKMPGLASLIAGKRKAFAPHRRMGSLQILGRQRFFLGVYLRYFGRYFLGRRKTVFERWRS